MHVKPRDWFGDGLSWLGHPFSLVWGLSGPLNVCMAIVARFNNAIEEISIIFKMPLAIAAIMLILK